MKKRTASIIMAAILANGITMQPAEASETTGEIQFSGKLHSGRIQATKNSTLRLTSMKLQGSSFASALKMNTQAQLSGPLELKKGAQLRVASLDMNNGRIGRPADLQMHVQVQNGISAGQNSDIGIGGVQISVDDNYTPQASSASGDVAINQQVNKGSILAAMPSRPVGTANMAGSFPNLHPNTQRQNDGTVGVQSAPVNTGTVGKMKPLGQRDPRWSNQKLGNTNLTLGNYGCLVTSLAMLRGTTPDKVNRILTKNNGFDRQGYLQHDVAAKTLGIGNGARHGKKWKPERDTIAEVRMQGKNGKSYQHFVVWRTDGTILDPWTGKVERQSKYPLVSFRDYHKG